MIVNFPECFRILWLARQIRHIGKKIINFTITLDGDQPTGKCKIGNGFTQVIANNPFYLIGIFNQLIKRAVFTEPLDRRFRSHFWHPGYIIHRIANQHQIIDNLLG